MTSPPAQLGQFQIIREIARSNDIVYEGFDANLDRRVAVKVLNLPPTATAAQRDDRMQRFSREAKAAGTLSHPAIMQVYAIGEDHGHVYMALEFLDGEPLRSLIDREGALPPDRCVEILSGVLEGLAFAHKKSVVHRDIKPDNVQIISTGHVKITDFGIARITHQPNLTIDGQIFGTPSYMAPEQVLGRDIDPRSDIFSVGVMLFEMLAGEKPFKGDSVVAITYAIVNTPTPKHPKIPAALQKVIERAMEKSPSARYQSAEEMEQALRTALTGPAPEPVAPNPYWTPLSTQPPPPATYAPSYDPYAAPTVPPPSGYAASGSPSPPGAYGAGVAPPLPPGAPSYGIPLPPGYAIPPSGAPPPPVYYPPPPRKPLLNADQKATVWRVIGITLAMGLLVAIVIAVMSAISSMAQGTSRLGDAPKARPKITPTPSAEAPTSSLPPVPSLPVTTPNTAGGPNIDALRAGLERAEAILDAQEVARYGEARDLAQAVLNVFSDGTPEFYRARNVLEQTR